MQLLTPTQTKDVGNEEMTRKVLRAQEIEKVVQDANIRLSKSEADFASMLARHNETWAKEEEEHRKDVLERQREVEGLEQRKTQALIPINLYKSEAEELWGLAQEALQRTKEKEEQADERLSLLENRLDDVAERENAASLLERQLEARKQGVEAQSKAVEEGAAKLSAEMVSFQAVKSKAEEEIYEKKKELQLREINLDAKEEKLRRDSEASRILDIQLKDRQATLERAWKELEAKQLPK